MRQGLFAGLCIAGLVAIAIPSASARERPRAATSTVPAAIQDRYCVQGYGWGYPGNCQFSTYEQCTATASGTGDVCGENPQYLFKAQRRGDWPPR